MKVHAKSPLRLGLAGGGTDVAPYSDLYGGLVLNATISLYTHCEISIASDNLVRFEASDFGDHCEMPAASILSLDGQLILHRAVYNRFIRQFNHGTALPLRVVTYSDAPPGSGVGSSSALVVAMVAAYCELLKIPLGEYDIAHLAFEIERIDCAMAGGKQDQYAAAFGGFNFMEFQAKDRVLVNPLRLKRELANELECRLLLYFTGRSRSSAKIIEEQIDATKSPNSDAIKAMHEIKRAALDMKDALLRGEINHVLDILGASWMAKKRTATAISNFQIETVANLAIEAGARGVKVSGAGGGGFMMIAVDPPNRHCVMRALEPQGGRFFSFGFVNEGVEAWTCTRQVVSTNIKKIS
jgi:D-glycero-alpha-D-manno-heptose-7-phosphate kinase